MVNNNYELCHICRKPIKEGQRAITLNLNDEVLKRGALHVYNSWNLVSYHKKCSPVKINKKVFEVKNGQ